MSPTTRPGVTLPELILVAWLFSLVLAGTARLAGAQGRLVALTHDHVRVEELVRATDLILGAELRVLAPPDMEVAPPAALRLRAVRGSGVICGSGSDHLVVRYRGVRRPDPTKDSVLVVSSASPLGTAYRILEVSGSTGCAGAVRLLLEGEALESVQGLAVVFETGSYSLTDGAVRYRRGAGGRQPVTEELLDEGTIVRARGDALSLRLRLDSAAVPRVTRLSPTLFIYLGNGSSP